MKVKVVKNEDGYVGSLFSDDGNQLNYPIVSITATDALKQCFDVAVIVISTIQPPEQTIINIEFLV